MEETSCPLCTEELDPTDLLLATRLCQCRFAVCLWCFRRLTEDAGKEGRPALCPNCREPYDTERIAREGRELHPEQYYSPPTISPHLSYSLEIIHYPCKYFSVFATILEAPYKRLLCKIQNLPLPKIWGHRIKDDLWRWSHLGLLILLRN